MTKRSEAEAGGRPRKRRRSSRVGTFVSVALIVGVVAAVALLYLYTAITIRFEGRLWTFPSRIYGAPFVVEAGDAIAAEPLARRLDRAGYARVTGTPERPGQYRYSPSMLEVFPRPFPGGASTPHASALRLRFDGGTLESIRAGSRAIRELELEPELLALVFGPQHEERQIVRYADLPRGFIQAVLAAEDARFFSHAGVDPLAMGRAGLANVKKGKIVQGGSTITQQTVKNLYLGQQRTWWRKLRELPMAFILDLRYSKERILEVYVNEVYLGQRGSVAICGAEAASRYFFGRSLQDLDTAEWALLAGLIRNPGGYNPFQNPKRAIERRNQVLGAMVELGWLDAKEAERAKTAPLRLASGGAGFARASYVMDFVRAQLQEEYDPKVLAEEGLRIQTTLDTVVQDAAERALAAGLEKLEREVPEIRRQKSKRRLQGAVVVMDPRDGAILALVGGRDYQGSQFDRAVHARRQPGSCFKPFVYLTAFEAALEGNAGGLTPASVIEDAPIEWRSGGKTWSPSNYDGEYHGAVTVRTALEHSYNVPAAIAAREVGLDAVVHTAERCGFPEGLERLPSLALGAQEVTPLELAQAYCSLANLGRRVTPQVIREVASRDGKALERTRPVRKRAVGETAAFLVTDILRGVLVRGTAASSSALGFAGDAAGKTGTTDDTRDAWFVGYTPDYLALVWVGYDDNAKTGLTGARGALPIWVDLMMRTRHRWANGSFETPEGIVRVEVDPESGERAVGGCPERIAEAFAAGTEPAASCHLHESGFRRWLRNLFKRNRKTA